MRARISSVVLVGCCVALLGFVSPAAAQMPNIDTIEGPSAGEQTTLMVSPYSLTDDVSGRALGVKSPNGTRFAITLIGLSPSDSVGLMLGGKSLPIQDISRPDEGEIGPTRVYVSQKVFLTVADQSGVRLRIGDTTTSFPAQMRKEMKRIFETVV